MDNETIQLAVDGVHGIYVPKRFFEMYPQFLEHLNEDDQYIINNPEHEQYWHLWEYFVDNFHVIKDGVRWSLYCDNDVFFVSEKHEFNN